MPLPDQNMYSCSTNDFSMNPQFQDLTLRYIMELGRLKRATVSSLIMSAQNEEESRKLQETLKLKLPEITEIMLEKFSTITGGGIPAILHLMIHQHGRHVFSKFIEACNEEQLKDIVMHITCSSQFIRCSLTQFGSLSIIKLIRVLKKSPLVDLVVRQLAVHAFRIMTEKNGLHIISECLDQLDEAKNFAICVGVMRHFQKIATHKQGCVSLNAVVENIRGPFRVDLIGLICKQAVFLAFDPSGNYVVQRVLALENPGFDKWITDNLRGRYASLSKLKEGSHLVEKCLLSTGMVTVVEDLIESNQVLSLCGDRFGNYVIQTALRVTIGIPQLHSRLLTCICPHPQKLQRGFGRIVYNRILHEIPPAAAAAGVNFVPYP